MNARVKVFLAVIILAGIAARAWLLFSTPFMPGMNGGYYLVQARSLIEKYALGIPDLPLVFALQAALGWLLNAVIGRGLEPCVLLSVKLVDAILPPLTAWPVFVIGWRWSKRLGRGEWLAVAGATCVAAGAPALSMVGDFEKNSLGLLWLAWLLCELHAWINGSRGATVATVALLGLVGVTHIGVFGTALLLVALVFVAHLALEPRGFAHLPWRWIASSVAVVAMAGAIVLWKFDPARVHRLIGAIANPSEFLSGGMPKFGGAPGMPPGGAPMRPPGAMGGMRWMRWAPAVLFALASVPALVLAWRKRDDLLPGDHALAIGCALGVIALTGPWVQGDKQMRFALNAVIPAVLAGEFALLHLRFGWVRGALGGLGVAFFIGAAVPLLARGGRPILDEAALRELASLSPEVRDPARTLVCARHGVEWWTAWLLHTHVAQVTALRPADWQHYDVLFLEVKNGMQFPMGGPGRGPGPGRGFPPMGAPDAGGRRPDFARPWAMPPPPPNMRGRGPMGPMMGPSIPADATVLHDGQYVKLARIATPPKFVEENEKSENAVAPP